MEPCGPDELEQRLFRVGLLFDHISHSTASSVDECIRKALYFLQLLYQV